MDTIAPYLLIPLPVIFVLAIVILLIAIFQDSKTTGRAQAMRNTFVTIMSLVAFFITMGTLLLLVFLGLRQTIFTDAFYNTYRYSTPPSLYVTPEKLDDASIEVCDTDKNTCTLTDAQRNEISNWVENYREWKNDVNQVFSLSTREGLIDAFSVFIIALPLYGLFYFLLRRRTVGKERSNMELTYYYGIAFTSLAAAAVGVIILVNVGLRNWLLPDSTSAKNVSQYDMPVDSTTETSLARITACGTLCDLPADATIYAAMWPIDTKEVLDKKKNANPYADDYAVVIPLILIGSLSFAYHFTTGRKERKLKKK